MNEWQKAGDESGGEHAFRGRQKEKGKRKKGRTCFGRSDYFTLPRRGSQLLSALLRFPFYLFTFSFRVGAVQGGPPLSKPDYCQRNSEQKSTLRNEQAGDGIPPAPAVGSFG